LSFYDLHIPVNFNGKLIVFVHGYKGCKDWGAWNLLDFECTEMGYGFAKFNLSHNGANHLSAKDFPDLEAFSKNTYSKEIEDVRLFMDHLDGLNLPKHSRNVIGHSRGGGVGLIAASVDSRIHAICTWAAISSIANRMPKGEELDAWRKQGVRYETNTRTKQEMPIAYSMYEDFENNMTFLDIQRACEELSIPRMVIHGGADEAVALEEGKDLATWLNVPLFEIPGANHTFGVKHPMQSYRLPEDMKTVFNLTLGFFGQL
jgi:pimeloyl-ACP methyl ester carboxylesterase